MANFFDEYPIFYENGVAPFPARLNARYRAIIEWNKDVIAGARVLDIASHNGRWTAAAILGARSDLVTCVEIRPELNELARKNLAACKVTTEQYRIVQTDVQDYLWKCSPLDFDVILCCGYLYHTPHPLGVLRACCKLRPKLLVIDSNVILSDPPRCELREEDPAGLGSAFAPGVAKTLVEVPSLSFISLALRNSGREVVEVFDWKAQQGDEWAHLEEYRDRLRETVRSTRKIVPPA